MSLVAEFHVDARLLRPTLTEVSEMRVEVEQEVALDTSGSLFTFWASRGDFAAFEEALKRDDTIERFQQLSADIDGWRLYRVTVPPTESSYWKWAELGAVLLDATGWPDGWDFRMRFPNKQALNSFAQFCREWGVTFTLVRIERAAGPRANGLSHLTPPQRELLSAAHENGYFAVPRETTLKELADQFNISHQAASKRLQRALSNLLDYHDV